MKSLLLTEKPSVARDIAGVIGGFAGKNGYLENSDYVITWAIGHLAVLANPEDYDQNLKKWFMNTLPIVPDFKLKPNPNTKKQLDIIENLLKRPDIRQIICATDAGREGELIFRYIYQITDCTKPFQRLWLSETTPSAIKNGLANLRPGSHYDNLARAAEARSQADWLVGINATRAFTVKYGTLFSVGRVQTPTLALIVNREQEIKTFVSVPYWELYARFAKDDGQTYIGKWYREGADNRFAALEAAQAIQAKITEQPAMVANIEAKDLVEMPPLLFNLNDLQKETNKKHGFSAAHTLKVAQSLYENKKLITYPRTDSRHLTKELAQTIGARLAALATMEVYHPLVTVISGHPGKRYIDDSKVTDHTALIPTATRPNLNALSIDERIVYDLIAKRFIAIFYPPAKYKQTKVITEVQGETFLTTGKVEIQPGWKVVYHTSTDKTDSRKDSEEDALIPILSPGEILQVEATEIQEKKTLPPKRYTEASLLSIMEGAGRLLDDQALKEVMKGHGLGTPATRAAIIERLIEVGYMKRHKKALIPTEKGEAIINLVPDLVKSPEMTGEWEKALLDIEQGKRDSGEFMLGITSLTGAIVELVRNQAVGDGYLAENQEGALGRCPLCGRAVLEYKKSYSCSGYRDGCKFVIWKEIAGKKITKNQAEALLAKGETGIINDFNAKSGKKFAAALKINQGKVEFLFENSGGGGGAGGVGGGGVAGDFDANIELGRCPVCGKVVTEMPRSFSCNGYKDGCGFVVWKEIAGQNITREQVLEIMQKGRTGVIKNFKSRAGRNFDAALVLNQDGKVQLDWGAR